MPQLVFQGLDVPLLRAIGETELQEKPESDHKYPFRNLGDFTRSQNVLAWNIYINALAFW